MGCGDSTPVKEQRKPPSRATGQQHQQQQQYNNYDRHETPPPAPTNQSFVGPGRRLGGAGGSPHNGNPREMAAAAAAARKQQPIPGFSRQATEELRSDVGVRREELIYEIEVLCRERGEDPPLGLPTCDLAQLRKHKAYLESKKPRR